MDGSVGGWWVHAWVYVIQIQVEVQAATRLCIKCSICPEYHILSTMYYCYMLRTTYILHCRAAELPKVSTTYYYPTNCYHKCFFSPLASVEPRPLPRASWCRLTHPYGGVRSHALRWRQGSLSQCLLAPYGGVRAAHPDACRPPPAPRRWAEWLRRRRAKICRSASQGWTCYYTLVVATALENNARAGAGTPNGCVRAHALRWRQGSL